MELKQLDAHVDRPSRETVEGIAILSSTDVADVLDVSCVMRKHIRPLWNPGMQKTCGPAFTVKTGKHDNLMFHAALYLAHPGDVLVCEAGDDEMAQCGGNICAIAQKRGIHGFVIDGVARDVSEIREIGFPIFASGVSPIPGQRVGDGYVNKPVTVGGIKVSPGDIVIADEDGVVVVPRGRAESVLVEAREKMLKDFMLTPEQWRQRHLGNVEAALAKRGLKL